jgi:hypothetical protein
MGFTLVSTSSSAMPTQYPCRPSIGTGRRDWNMNDERWLSVDDIAVHLGVKRDTIYKVYLVEIKSRPGRLRSDTGTWIWSHEGRDFVDDNPLLLANRKAKKLKSFLQSQGALRKHRVPYSGLHMDGVQINGSLHSNYSPAPYATQLQTAIL